MGCRQSEVEQIYFLRQRTDEPCSEIQISVAHIAARNVLSIATQTFSKGVRTALHLKWQSYLILLEKQCIFSPKNGHEPPDSDLRLQLRCLSIKELWMKKCQLPAKLPANGELDETQVVLVHYSGKTLAVLADGHFAASDCVGFTERGRE